MGNITQFFYNIIPGLVLVFSLSWITSIKLEEFFSQFTSATDDKLFFGSILTISGLLLGFFLQGFTKLIREIFKLNEKVFYAMHNILEAKNVQGFGKHYESRFAFWSNIFFLCFIMFLLSISSQIFSSPISKYINIDPATALSSTIAFGILQTIGAWQSKTHMIALYDTVFKTYYGLKKMGLLN